ncbi:hypothetical protein [Seohaeicola sp. SP36]|nr:hypothetical protein [Seohaeicola sp. SP36]MDF1708309.1 hypothetical protein [Paracoccaceae bacterium]
MREVLGRVENTAAGVAARGGRIDGLGDGGSPGLGFVDFTDQTV